MPNFLKSYEYLFFNKEYKFKSEAKLVSMVLSALTLELVNPQKSIIGCLTSPKIYFIHSGKVSVFYKKMEYKLTTYSSGCYFGDISMLYKIQNNFRYMPYDNKTKVLSISE